jgi:hypothetical protein
MHQQCCHSSNTSTKMWLEGEDDRETRKIEEDKKLQKEKEKDLAQQRKQTKKPEEPTARTAH